MKPCEITLPFPPSVNVYKQVGRLKVTKKGKIYQTRVNTPETKRYYQSVWVTVYKLRVTEGLQSFSNAKISVEIDAYPSDHKRRDLDNIAKVLVDSLQRAQLFDDDFQISRLLITRKDTISGGKVVVRIRQFEEG